MALNLQKGQREALSAQKFMVGLGWDVSSQSPAVDLDASVFMLNAAGKIPSDDYVIYFGQHASPNQSVVHSGDNLTGDGDGDDEQIVIDLNKLEAGIEQIVVVVNIYEALDRRQNFGQVRNAFIRIVDTSGAELMKYELDEDFSVETGLEFGRLYLRGGAWKFEAMGIGSKADLGGFMGKYS
ncbi:MAG: TerD family protein [Bacteroidota bacterium]